MSRPESLKEMIPFETEADIRIRVEFLDGSQLPICFPVKLTP